MVSKVVRAFLVCVLVVSGSAALTQSADPLAPIPENVRPAALQSTPTIIAPRPVQPAAPRGFEAYKARLAYLARLASVREATIAAVIPTLEINERAIRLDRAQPGQVNNPYSAPPFAPYRARHVTADLISRGAAKYRQHYARLAAIEQRTGVPASVMLGIYGKETSYGRITGNFDVLDALASLAYEGRRRPWRR